MMKTFAFADIKGQEWNARLTVAGIERIRSALGKLPDEEVAAKIGRSKHAVRIMRGRLGIARACDRRKKS